MPPTKQEATKLLTAALASIPRLIRAVQWNRPAEALAELQPLVASLREAGVSAGGRPLEQALRELEQRSLRGSVAVPSDLIGQAVPARGLVDLYLDDSLRDQVGRVILEARHAEALRRFHCTPRHRILLYGPPRNGKTSLAEALAFELELPFLVVKSAGLLESHLGDTSKNLAKVFDYASSIPCVLFFDEVDTYATRRGAGQDVGEVARMTNTLLQLVERLPASCIFIAATNRADDLDPAFLGRMQLRVAVPLPSKDTLLKAAQRELRAELTPGNDLSARAAQVVAEHADSVAKVLQSCEDLRREVALQSVGVDLDRG